MYKRTLLRIFVVALAISIVLITLFTKKWKKSTNGVNYVSVKNVHNDIKHILYWSPYWHAKDYYYGYGFNPFKDCEYKNCYATDNRTFIPLEQYDALLFHATYEKKKHGVPWTRTSNQRYILLNMEPPLITYPDLKQHVRYFNWTMSYRHDSDVVKRYGYIVRKRTNYVVPSPEIIKNKRKRIAWFVSHCKTPGKRELFVRQLQKFIAVDVYGKCGNLECEKDSSDCYDMVERDYKFYLSFENSVCQEYVTEKLYKLLQKNVVPVVYGGSDYNITVPPHSVINVANFDSADDLAAYMQFLDKNDAEYVRYFEWKTDYVVKISPLISACQLCQKLNEPFRHKVYHDLHEWWWGVNNSKCKTGQDLPKIISSVL